MRNYEQLIEYIINDETDKAKELFHSLVVEKSREIYNDLVAEEMEDEMQEMEHGDDADDMMSDIQADHEGMDSNEDHDEMDHDEHDEFGGEEHDEGSMEDRVMDLEDALDELKAEFESLMADEANEPEHHDGVDDPDFGAIEAHDMDHDMAEEGVVREYVEKVKDFYKGDNGEGSGVGAGSVGGTTNSKSIVAGKNDMGGTASNIARGGKNEDPDNKQYKDPSNQYAKGRGNLPGAGKFENVPGASAGKAFSNAKKPTTSEPSGVNKKTPLAR
jgi:hypothetical protein